MKNYEQLYRRFLPVLIGIAAAMGLLYLLSGGPSILHSSQEPAESGAEEEKIVLKIFDKNMTGQQFDDAVAEEIMKRTGVTIELVDATNTPEKTLEMMQINKTYPDIILMEQGEMVNRFIQAGVFLPLNDLIEEYGSNISEMYGDILERSRSEDGTNYWLANWYGEDTDASAGVLMRKDYLTELVGEERAESTEPFTLSEYTELLRAFKELHPEVDGKESIPLDLDGEGDTYEMTLKGIFGMKTYEEDEEGNLTYLPASEQYREALLYMNSLFTEGLLSDEWMIDRTEKWISSLKSGAVFSTWCSYWDTDEANELLKSRYREDAQFYCYKVVADDLDVTETTFNGRSILGWDAIGITDNCSNPEAAIKVLDFLASEEGQYLLLWGVEGDTWNLENGVHVPETDFLAMWSLNSASMEQTTGVRRWKWCIKNGNGSDGTPYDLTTKYNASELVTFANERFLDSDYWDTSEYASLEPGWQSDLGLSWQQIEETYSEYYTKIICASDREEAEALYDRMLSDMELYRLEECEAYITEQYKNR